MPWRARVRDDVVGGNATNESTGRRDDERRPNVLDGRGAIGRPVPMCQSIDDSLTDGPEWQFGDLPDDEARRKVNYGIVHGNGLLYSGKFLE